MTLKEYLRCVDTLLKENPEILDLPVVWYEHDPESVECSGYREMDSPPELVDYFIKDKKVLSVN